MTSPEAAVAKSVKFSDQTSQSTSPEVHLKAPPPTPADNAMAKEETVETLADIPEPDVWAQLKDASNGSLKDSKHASPVTTRPSFGGNTFSPLADVDVNSSSLRYDSPFVRRSSSPSKTRSAPINLWDAVLENHRKSASTTTQQENIPLGGKFAFNHF